MAKWPLQLTLAMMSGHDLVTKLAEVMHEAMPGDLGHGHKSAIANIVRRHEGTLQRVICCRYVLNMIQAWDRRNHHEASIEG